MNAYLSTQPTKTQAWILASRPKTLPAAMMPAVMGSAMAIHDGVFALGPALVALICALLIQIGTNFSNDLLDYKAGADTEKRTGPARAVANRWITEGEMLGGTIISFGLTVPLGLYLIWVAGWPVLVIGLLSIASGLAYSAGPIPLAYNGLGDIFVFIFFGLVATAGTYFVQAQTISAFVLWGSVPAGALITNILVINNYRDIETDLETNKRTLATILGKTGSQIEYLLLLLASYAVPFLYVMHFDLSYWILLPLISLPFGLRIFFKMLAGVEGTLLNDLLAQTAQLALGYGILFSVGLLL